MGDSQKRLCQENIKCQEMTGPERRHFLPFKLADSLTEKTFLLVHCLLCISFVLPSLALLSNRASSLEGSRQGIRKEILPILRTQVDAVICRGRRVRGSPIHVVISLLFHLCRLQRTLPAGRSFIAMDTKEIPQILQQIFTSTMLSGV